MIHPRRSLRRWLSRWLVLQTFAALGLVCAVVYISVDLNLMSRQRIHLEERKEVIVHLVQEFDSYGDLSSLKHKLEDFFYGKSELSLRLNVNGELVTYGPDVSLLDAGDLKLTRFTLAMPGRPDMRMEAQLLLDASSDRHLLSMLAWTLFACALGGALIVSVIADVLVRRALDPLRDVGRQAEQLSPDRIGERLDESGLAEELQPLVRQFNQVLQRLERAYVQMEGFNADVAHELRTPLATLVGQTELALSAPRSSETQREMLGSNLEELQRMSGIINDMLFLAQADGGATARSRQPADLRELVQEVLAYHEAEALDAGVSFAIVGDRSAEVDRTLFQRAVSNLVSNAVRYAYPDTQVEVHIQDIGDSQVRIAVRNIGDPIDAEHLPRLFHRFYRLDSSRASDTVHHGLGLAIVAAIARMHGGQSYAASDAAGTTIGFSVDLGR